MIDHVTRCFACEAEVSAGSRVCPACGAVMRSRPHWPDWHGNPEQSGGGEVGREEGDAGPDDAAPAIETLALDPALVDVHPGRPGQRRLLVGLIVAGVAWFLVGLLYELGDPARWWDIVWYVAGILTVLLAIWLLVVLAQRTRTHGFRPALRWLVS
jgi:hypothetical protein